jgi:hypothetical protein
MKSVQVDGISITCPPLPNPPTLKLATTFRTYGTWFTGAANADVQVDLIASNNIDHHAGQVATEGTLPGSNLSWSANFTSIPAGTNYTLKASVVINGVVKVSSTCLNLEVGQGGSC